VKGIRPKHDKIGTRRTIDQMNPTITLRERRHFIPVEPVAPR